MGDQNQTGNSGYQGFIEKLKQDNCREFVAKLQTFSVRFPTEISRERASELFLTFLSRAEEKIFMLEAFGDSLAQKSQVADYLEKFLLKLLEGKLAQPEDGVMDKVLFEKMGKMIDRLDLAKHLKGPDAADVDRSILELAIKELSDLENYRAPKDKLQCFVNAQKIIKYALEITNKPWGAEELLPLTIYTVVLARPKKLASDVKLIRHFSKPERLQGETDYIFTQLEMTAEFIANFDIRLLRKLSTEQIAQIDQLAIRYLNRENASIPMKELPELINEAMEIDKFLTNAGFESDLDLARMKIDQILDLLNWYMRNADFVLKLKNLV
jgi:hypothetical protein